MTASWPAFIGGAALVFVVFNTIFGFLYWLGDNPISNVTHSDYIDYLYFSIETLAFDRRLRRQRPQTHYGHFIATVELFTGIFSMSVMTGLIAAFLAATRTALFANNPVISTREGKRTLMVRIANERHNIIGNATARIWALQNVVNGDGHTLRRFTRAFAREERAPGSRFDMDAFSRARRKEPARQSRCGRHGRPSM